MSDLSHLSAQHGLKVMSADQINWCIVSPYIRGRKLTRKTLQSIAKTIYEEEMIKVSTLEKLIALHIDELDILPSDGNIRGKGYYDLGNAILEILPLRSLILDKIMVQLYVPEKKHMVSWLLVEDEVSTSLPSKLLKCPLTTPAMRKDIQMIVKQYLCTT